MTEAKRGRESVPSLRTDPSPAVRGGSSPEKSRRALRAIWRAIARGFAGPSPLSPPASAAETRTAAARTTSTPAARQPGRRAAGPTRARGRRAQPLHSPCAARGAGVTQTTRAAPPAPAKAARCTGTQTTAPREGAGRAPATSAQTTEPGQAQTEQAEQRTRPRTRERAAAPPCTHKGRAQKHHRVCGLAHRGACERQFEARRPGNQALKLSETASRKQRHHSSGGKRASSAQGDRPRSLRAAAPPGVSGAQANGHAPGRPVPPREAHAKASARIRRAPAAASWMRARDEQGATRAASEGGAAVGMCSLARLAASQSRFLRGGGMIPLPRTR